MEIEDIEVIETPQGLEIEKPQVCGKPAGNIFVRIWNFYVDGFKNMTIGKYLWIIILAKLAVMFLVFKLFFFPNILERDYATDEERAQAVRTHLTQD